MLGLILVILLLTAALGVSAWAPKETWAHNTSAVLLLALIAVAMLWGFAAI